MPQRSLIGVGRY